MAHALAGRYDSGVRYLSHAARRHTVERDVGPLRAVLLPRHRDRHINGDSPDPGQPAAAVPHLSRRGDAVAKQARTGQDGH